MPLTQETCQHFEISESDSQIKSSSISYDDRQIQLKPSTEMSQTSKLEHNELFKREDDGSEPEAQMSSQNLSISIDADQNFVSLAQTKRSARSDLEPDFTDSPVKLPEKEEVVRQISVDLEEKEDTVRTS